MNFYEPNKSVITIPKYEKCFIYFLLKENEVVYVGQTTQGIIRPFAHKDKDFDEVKIIYCEPSELDITEDSYIQKYKPLYNKQNNYAVRWGLLRVRNCIRLKFYPDYTIPKLKKLMKQLNIQPLKDCYNGKLTITFDEYKQIMEHLKGVENGRY